MLSVLRAQETPPTPAQESQAPSEPAAAEPSDEIRTRFELLATYNEKIEKLREFERTENLQTADLQQRKSRAADEISRLIGGLESLMQQEAEEIYDHAMSAEPEERDQLLKRLSEVNYFQLEEIRRRVNNELSRRTVGDKLYPTIEEATEAQRKLIEERQKEIDEQDVKRLEALDELKQDLLTDRILEAAQKYGEEEAEAMLENALRLVLPQQRVQLQEIVRKHPKTLAATKAKEILTDINRQNQDIAGWKLERALNASVVFDQRWRRLKEIERDHPNTPAAVEAKHLFEQHLAQVPPVTISNPTTQDVEMTVDRPYSKMVEMKLPAGETRIFPSAFPQMIRVQIRENEWDVYRVWPGKSFVFEAPHGFPVLCPAP